MALVAMFAAVLAVCAWITVPALEIVFTLQTFGIFLTLGLLGGKWGTAAIGLYTLMGAVGLPVFSGFRGGLGVLLGVTGGYIWGFLASGLVYWSITRCLPERKWVSPLAMAAGLLACYACGTLWYLIAYTSGGTGSLAAVLAKCVLPFILPDICKLLVALPLVRRLRRFINL